MTKKLPDLTDMREIAIEVQKRIGGIAEMVKWAKSHRTLWYQLYPKLLAQPPQTNVQVNIANVNGEQARKSLQDAFMRVIASQKASVGDPAVYVDGQRVIDGKIIDNEPPSPAASHDARDPALRDSAQQSAAPHDSKAAPATQPATQPDNVVNIDRKPFHPAARPPQAAPREPTSTELYLEWSASRRDPWSAS
ncbi:hypothetical protein SAMN05444321_1916 [Bradyrhizobium lablabi]|nr:hypothetical protein SAMN05444321_1916 [Bradyrhizobium lablabi]